VLGALPVRLDHSVIHVSDWERSNSFYARVHLEECGVEVEEGPVTRVGARGPGTSLYFRDPDGSLLELISYR